MGLGWAGADTIVASFFRRSLKYYKVLPSVYVAEKVVSEGVTETRVFGRTPMTCDWSGDVI